MVSKSTDGDVPVDVQGPVADPIPSIPESEDKSDQESETKSDQESDARSDHEETNPESFETGIGTVYIVVFMLYSIYFIMKKKIFLQFILKKPLSPAMYQPLQPFQMVSCIVPLRAWLLIMLLLVYFSENTVSKPVDGDDLVEDDPNGKFHVQQPNKYK